MQTALDTYLAASQQSLQSHKDLIIATVGIGYVLYVEAVVPFYRSAWDAFEMCAKIAFPRVRAADVVELGAVRTAKRARLLRRAEAMRG